MHIMDVKYVLSVGDETGGEGTCTSHGAGAAWRSHSSVMFRVPI